MRPAATARRLSVTRATGACAFGGIMKTIRARHAGRGMAALACASTACAQSVAHTAFLDLDSNAATGCSVTTAAGNIAGIEVRVDATVSSQPPQVGAVTRSSCVGGAFGPATSQPAGYAV